MKYRSKPVIKEAIQFDGENHYDLAEWAIQKNGAKATRFHPEGHEIYIDTLEGTMTASRGDYIIKGLKGEFYPCKPDIFEASYEKVEE